MAFVCIVFVIDTRHRRRRSNGSLELCHHMYAEERRQLICDALDRDGRVTVAELAERYDVVTETIRRDLDTLESSGLLTRVHGGAIAKRTADPEPDLPTRLSTNTAAKKRIALAASRSLPSGPLKSVLLDAGSTTLELVGYLSGRNLQVVTNAVGIAQAALMVTTDRLDLLPGRLRHSTHAAVGVDTVQALSRLHPDVAFIGCNGMSAAGFTTPDVDEAATKTAMVTQAGRRIVLADSSKAGLVQLVTFAELGEIDVLVTDSGLSDSYTQLFEDNGIEVVRA